MDNTSPERITGKLAAMIRLLSSEPMRRAGETRKEPAPVENAMERCAIMPEREVESRIVEACRQGDREAFRLLFEAYKDKVYSIALHFLSGDTASAEDITQEVFLKLFTRIGQYRSEAEFATWLYRLVANACMDEHRRRRHWAPFDESASTNPTLGQDLPEEAFQRQEVAASVQAALADLSPDVRLTVCLKYFEELSYEEMSAALGCSKGTIASRLHRGLKVLARKLDYLRPRPVSGD